jgi:hypothetical protein
MAVLVKPGGVAAMTAKAVAVMIAEAGAVMMAEAVVGANLVRATPAICQRVRDAQA